MTHNRIVAPRGAPPGSQDAPRNIDPTTTLPSAFEGEPECVDLIDALLPPTGEPTLRGPALAQLLGVSPETLAAMVRSGALPAPLRLGPKLHVYGREEVRLALRRLRQREGA